MYIYHVIGKLNFEILPVHRDLYLMAPELVAFAHIYEWMQQSYDATLSHN